jgi:protease IV
MPGRTQIRRSAGKSAPILAAMATFAVVAGCNHAIPVEATFRGGVDANVSVSETAVRGAIDVKLPSAVDPGEMMETVVRTSPSPGSCPRVALVDVDGLLFNQNYGGLQSVGDNPLSALRDKLAAAAADPRVGAVVVRINSPGGSVTACDIMAEELRRFRAHTRKPVVACLMEVATSGAYFIAAESDRIIAHPTALTGGLGVVFNHSNLQDAMAMLNLVTDPVKSGPKIDMGTVTGPLDDGTRAMLQQMADSYRDYLLRRVKERRGAMTAADMQAVSDGRVILASQALALHLVDRLGYLPDAIAEAESLAGASGAEVVLFHRSAYPARSLYAITPSPAALHDVVPFSYPGLDRSKLPTFMYLWQPDPTLPRLGSK